MNIYICHYTKLLDRYNHVTDELNKYDFSYNFITNFDKETIPNEYLSLFILNTRLPITQVSLLLKHIECYKIISKQREKKTYNLILEDDVILCKNFKNTLTNYLTQLPDTFDMLFIGDGCYLHIPKHNIEENKNIYLKCNDQTSWGGMGATRCTDSYLISNECCKKILNYFDNQYIKNDNKIDIPIGWWLNSVIRELNLKVYWAEPTIVTQGTQVGKFETSIKK